MAKKQQNKEYDGSEPLNSILQERFVNFLLTGLPQYKAYDEAGYGANSSTQALATNSSRLLKDDKIQARLNYRRKEIAVKSDITVGNLQKDLQRQRLLAELRGETSAAIRCNELLLKTIGGLQADAPSDKAIAARMLDKGISDGIRKLVDSRYKRKYLAEPDVNVVDWTGQEGVSEAVESTNTEGIDQSASERETGQE